jgi:hypothetical protein
MATTLEHDTPIPITQGRWQYVVDAGTGTVTFQVSKDNGTTFQNMVNGAFTTDSDGIIIFGNVHFKALITGNAAASIDYVGP